MIGLTFHPLKYNKFHTVVLLSISFFSLLTLILCRLTRVNEGN